MLRRGASTEGKESNERKESTGGPTESLEIAILRDLENQVPWNKISQKFHVSTKTINEVRKRGATTPIGSVAAEAFRLFECGASPIEVVTLLRVEPDLVEDLWAKWGRLKRALILSDVDVNEIAQSLGRTQDQVMDVRELKKAISELQNKSRVLIQCYVCQGVIDDDRVELLRELIRFAKDQGYGLRHDDCHP